MSTADLELEATIRRVEAQEARARRRVIAVTAVVILLGVSFLAVVGKTIVTGRQDVTAKGEQLTKANAELALYTQPATKIRGELEQLTVARDEKWDKLTASIKDAESVQIQLAETDNDYARSLAAAEERSKGFNREVEATIANINQRLDELKRPPNENQPEKDPNRVRLQRDPRGSREEAGARGTLIKALTTQRQMLEDALNQSRNYQSTMAGLRKRLELALAAANQAHAEVGATDRNIGSVCRVAVGRNAAGK